MNPAEQKKFLQSVGAIPMGDDLMEPSFGGGRGSGVPGGGTSAMGGGGAGNALDMAVSPLRAYARSMNGEPEPPKQQLPSPSAGENIDYMAKIREMMTPEMMDKLKAKAGIGGGGGNGGLGGTGTGGPL